MVKFSLQSKCFCQKPVQEFWEFMKFWEFWSVNFLFMNFMLKYLVSLDEFWWLLLFNIFRIVFNESTPQKCHFEILFRHFLILHDWRNFLVYNFVIDYKVFIRKCLIIFVFCLIVNKCIFIKVSINHFSKLKWNFDWNANY